MVAPEVEDVEQAIPRLRYEQRDEEGGRKRARRASVSAWLRYVRTAGDVPQES